MKYIALHEALYFCFRGNVLVSLTKAHRQVNVNVWQGPFLVQFASAANITDLYKN